MSASRPSMGTLEQFAEALVRIVSDEDTDIETKLRQWHSSLSGAFGDRSPFEANFPSFIDSIKGSETDVWGKETFFAYIDVDGKRNTVFGYTVSSGDHLCLVGHVKYPLLNSQALPDDRSIDEALTNELRGSVDSLVRTIVHQECGFGFLNGVVSMVVIELDFKRFEEMKAGNEPLSIPVIFHNFDMRDTNPSFMTQSISWIHRAIEERHHVRAEIRRLGMRELAGLSMGPREMEPSKDKSGS